MRSWLSSGFALVALSCQTPGPERIDFARDIAPIFRDRCYGCHGEQQSNGQLRLDSREIAFEEGPSGHRLVPHRPKESELYRRVAGTGPRERMPLGGSLDSREVERIRLWIEEGAEWPARDSVPGNPAPDWAYSPPERREPPAAGRGEWTLNAIDRFVLARLEAAGMDPSPRATKETLLRRLTLDLTGLPPTIGEIDTFLADTRPGSYGRQVDRLLASPHYGEHWGRVWLDAARYADSNGYEKDKPRQVWAYRDWVVGAFNSDMPYDRFVIEQVAGDLLPDAGQSQQVATGFLRNSMVNEEGGADPEQFRMEALFDRMEALGKAVLGLTVQCAQCHDHKYDPISQREYFGMLAMLNDSYESSRAVYSPGEQRERRRVLDSVREVEQALQRSTPDWRDRLGAWEAEASAGLPQWTVLDARIELGSGEKYRVLPDKSILAQGFAPTQSTVSPVAAVNPGTVRAVRLELLTDPRLPLNGPGRSFRGTAALSEFNIEAAVQSAPGVWTAVPVGSATADISPAPRLQDPVLFPQADGEPRTVGGIGLAIDGDDLTAWHTDTGPGHRNSPSKAVFRLAEPLSVEEPSLLRFNMVMKHGGSNTDADHSQNLGRFRLSVTEHANASADPLPAPVRAIVSGVPPPARTPEQEALLFRLWRSTVPAWEAANRQIERLWQEFPEGTTQLVAVQRDEPRVTYVLDRGDFLRPLEPAEPGVPSAMHPMAAVPATPGRLELAEWLVDRRAPTAARAIVNRIWRSHFGVGLVESVEDLGTRSSQPSHPALLDWLAVELMESDWSLKHVHRLIVLSETYRQSSKIEPEGRGRDPRNRLLARAGRFRVDAETVRDIALGASGLLVRDLGGRPVYPPAPELLFRPPASYAPKRWPVESGRHRFRRGLYTFRYRSVPYPAFETFDAPSGKFSCVRRERSNTPLQALVTLNESAFLESARFLALAALAETAADEAGRVGSVFRRVLSRRPASAERSELLSLLRRLRSRFARDGRGAHSLAFDGSAIPPGAAVASETELAAWTALARVVLNLDEAIMRE